MQKLETNSGSSDTSVGHAVLPFKAQPQPPINHAKGSTGTSKDILHKPEIVVQPPSIDDPVNPSLAFDLPSFSQVDMSVLEALPRELREELENEYRRRSTSPFVSGGPAGSHQVTAAAAAPVPVQQPLNNKINRQSVGPSVFPQKPKSETNYKRITRQLAPRSRATVSPTKSTLYAWALPKTKKTRVSISEAKLKDLGLDPEVFAVLPIKVQREQLVMARLIKAKGSLPEPPAERKILKAPKAQLPPGFVTYRAPNPKAKHIQPPFLRQQGKTKNEKLYFTETDDIQRIVETWLTTYRHWTPKEKDVDFLSKYLLQSVDRSKATDVGVERAIAVMKWWLVLSRRFWPASEYLEEEDLVSSQRDPVGEAWWDAFRRVKDGMDAIARRRFGGKLSLR